MADREFLDWSQPCISSAARWLVDRHAGDGLVDLRGIECVLPGRRAGRLLLWTLLRECASRQLHLIPPNVLTPGAMTSALLQPGVTIATEVARVLAWVSALRATPADEMSRLMTSPPAPDEVMGWYELARMLHRVDDELGGGGVQYSRVIDAVERAELVREGERWQAIAAVQSAQRECLTLAGLHDPNDAGFAALARGDMDSAVRIVLIGIVELNQLQRDVLSAFGDRVTALVHAPKALTDRFDELGCVIRERWSDHTIEIDDADLTIADRPRDVAQAALRDAIDFGRERISDDLTIGLGDEAMGETLAMAATHVGADVHLASGTTARTTEPFLLLVAIAAWLDDQSFANFAALVRHSDLERALRTHVDRAERAVSDWLGVLDRYFNDHLQSRLDGNWLGEAPEVAGLKHLHDRVLLVLSPLAGQARPVSEWMPPILDVLSTFYGEINARGSSRTERRLVDACRAIQKACASIASLSSDLRLSAHPAAAIRMVLDLVSREPMADEPRDRAIEALGWLELHLDDAPHTIITHINDGKIPQTVSADSFLNDSLRQRLDLANNESRYARDAYLLEAIRASRSRTTLIAGRRDARGEPLAPSRLLLACGREHLASRVKHLTDEAAVESWPLPMGATATTALSQFSIPRPPAEPVQLDRLSVTRFKAYLECPYRFWLRHIAQLEAFADRAHELDPLRFGDFAHAVLQRFGEDEVARASTNPSKILAFLEDSSQQEAAARFGPSPPPAVRIQLARLQQRLEAFAYRQAQHRQDGWAVIHTEQRLHENTHLDIPDANALRLTGKIDRIDQRAGEYLLIDYKTSERSASPRETHGPKNDSWFDLQLPLYHFAYSRYMNASIDAEKVSLAYITLSKKPSEVDVKIAQWNRAELAHALDTARVIVQKIRAGKFWPPKVVDAKYDDFKFICQTTAFASPQPDVDDEEGDA